MAHEPPRCTRWRIVACILDDGHSRWQLAAQQRLVGAKARLILSFWDAERQVAVTVPSVNATLTLFRLGELDHDAFWHCIKSHDVHRFSMGFALDEISARLLVRDAARNLGLV